MDNVTLSFFEGIEEELDAFSEKHNLLVEKYWHESKSWRFSFKHPNNGIGSIELGLDDNGRVEIGGYYWIDEYDAGKRFSKTYKVSDINVEEIQPQLLEVLTLVIGWNGGDLTDAADGFRAIWQNRYSREEFYAFNDKYPEVRL